MQRKDETLSADSVNKSRTWEEQEQSLYTRAACSVKKISLKTYGGSLPLQWAIFFHLLKILGKTFFLLLVVARKLHSFFRMCFEKSVKCAAVSLVAGRKGKLPGPNTTEMKLQLELKLGHSWVKDEHPKHLGPITTNCWWLLLLLLFFLYSLVVSYPVL